MDYYEILGVQRGASEEEIKKAYREKAKQHHPDRNQGSKESEELFKQLSEAFETLGDPKKRRDYDMFGASKRPPGMGNPFSGSNGFGGIKFDFESIFNSPFAKKQQDMVASIVVELMVDVFTVANGSVRTISFGVFDKCPRCKGEGTEDPSSIRTCTKCKGSGQVYDSCGFLARRMPCPLCGGEKVTYKKCPECNGSRTKKASKKIDVRIPAGIRSGTVLTCRGQGNYSKSSKTNGDVEIKIGVVPHKFFILKNNDIHVLLPVSFKNAILGCRISVPGMYGDVDVDIPRCVENGKIIKVSGMGVPIAHNNNSKGDMFVHISVDVPQGISRSFEETIGSLDDSECTYKSVDLFSEASEKARKEREKSAQ